MIYLVDNLCHCDEKLQLKCSCKICDEKVIKWIEHIDLRKKNRQFDEIFTKNSPSSENFTKNSLTGGKFLPKSVESGGNFTKSSQSSGNVNFFYLLCYRTINFLT